MRTVAKRLIITFFCCGLLVFCLFYTKSTGDHDGGGFIRVFRKMSLYQVGEFDLQVKGYYFAGNIGNEVYLAHPFSSEHIVLIGNDTLMSKRIERNGYEIQAARILIDSPYFFLVDVVRHSIFRGKLGTFCIDTIAFDGSFFSEVAIVGETSLIRRTISRSEYEYTLSLENRDTLIYNDDLLQKQIDGLFCTDGMLHYDGGNRVVYVYFYRNEFFCSDTTLSLLFRGQTIDTTSHAAIEVGRIKSKNSITLASPPSIVNRRSCLDRNLLYINSRVRSDIENVEEFREYSVIDVYDLDLMGRYQYSFRVPHYRDLQMRAFRVDGQRIYSIHGSYLVVHLMTGDANGESFDISLK